MPSRTWAGRTFGSRTFNARTWNGVAVTGGGGSEFPGVADVTLPSDWRTAGKWKPSQPEPKREPEQPQERFSAVGVLGTGLIRLIARPLIGVPDSIKEGRIVAGSIECTGAVLLCEARQQQVGTLIEGVLEGYQARQKMYRRLALLEDLTRSHRGRAVPVEELMGVMDGEAAYEQT